MNGHTNSFRIPKTWLDFQLKLQETLLFCTHKSMQISCRINNGLRLSDKQPRPPLYSDWSGVCRCESRQDLNFSCVQLSATQCMPSRKKESLKVCVIINTIHPIKTAKSHKRLPTGGLGRQWGLTSRNPLRNYQVRAPSSRGFQEICSPRLCFGQPPSLDWDSQWPTIQDRISPAGL